MNSKILIGIGGGVAFGVIITLLLSSTGQPGSMMWGINSSNSTTPGKTVGMMNGIDEHFIEQMIPHHDGAIAMANLALQKAKRPEIKNLAQDIISAQEKEITEMQNWYKNWFGKDVLKGSFAMMEGGMMSGSGMHMGGQEEVQALEDATDFDKAFIESMIPHHQLAIMMAQMLKAGTDRPEMLALAENIIESQSKEILEMKNWYKSWYK
ncbi:hypothetical protein A2911_01695 [Candidatus Nomurabacteria bacterium RIFCSPLOWO2_01_FULL_40_15]|uniref:DUF305 domain-containing protein n=1 Tax=Candidatus Nomurabacteria bacterium RIFCSPLOWO2_01_FULL_40_15 TaxID=1801772 RepID=A0A1F6X8J3_9BACT|nr:MAG: hypothetical protein A2911_01695 [Candidatus Nomurabacteria bacterium RIFCSPLOWO2_01_FULL_40_15]